MAESVKIADYGKKIVSWKVPEYDKHERGRGWYVISAICGLLFLAYAFFSGNFLFAAIIIIAALVIIMHDGREPIKVDFGITDEGLLVGKRFYDYDEIKDFAIVYKPHQEVKNLYFEFKSLLKPRLSIPLNNLNPLPIRENLLRYLPEDLERTDQPVSEALAKMFKL
ncbi:MAG: hypothetical protein UU95_C0029G0024 [Parcubacteria group bacterium GW2011_GWC2_42_12]|uniref:DUF5673 domain-containing protein n=1 Tax=Candidatus Falkowbacteria bacterium RIFCSPHIGHO2_02_FULL_42_9 TaxID=1797986 RepID=A0A1F5S983_9BACT|nr:MAG: hypothetical protein UU95_C0029G0024 [Parcubacteria group bacterium GW2011_GWC2_42_12]OGF23023.1 MAG: hypothetical protein A3D45_00185 [Candidatus Falkowbacteria bacterium RIFCSPHIGHO2_02_FULL_42_9]